MNDATDNELLELEDGCWDAAGDPGFYADHFADDGLIGLPTGVIDKEGVMAAMKYANPWTCHTIDSPRLVEIGPDTAALVYQATARRTGDDANCEAAISSVYVRRGGRWQLIVHQQSPPLRRIRPAPVLPRVP